MSALRFEHLRVRVANLFVILVLRAKAKTDLVETVHSTQLQTGVRL